MPYISVVTPVYGAVDIVDELYKRLVQNLERITPDFEIIMVNDACPQGSGAKIAAIAAKDSRVKFIDLARNFGQHIAISAGLDYAAGEYVVVMDCDLQDPPEKIAVMLEQLRATEKDVIFAIRDNRKDSFIKRAESWLFDKFMRLLTDKIYLGEYGAGNFSVITRKVVLACRRFNEHHRSYGSIIKCCGFEFSYIHIEGAERFAGTSSYTFLKSLKHAMSILVQQSVKPLFISVFFSAVCFIFSFMFAFFILYKKITGAYDILGYASIMFSITFIGALVFMNIAVLSMYIANIFEECKGRPLYTLRDTMNIAHTSCACDNCTETLCIKKR